MSNQGDLTAFITAKTAAGRAGHTINWYSRMIGGFLVWAIERGLDTKKPETVEAHMSFLRKRKMSDATISGYYRALSVFYKWLVTRRRLESSPMDEVEPPHMPKRRKPHVETGDFRRLYASIDGNHWIDHRDRAILLTLLYTGLRSSELLALRLEDIDRASGIIKVNGGKGDQDRNVPFAELLNEPLDVYLASRPKHPTKRIFLAAAGEKDFARGPLTYNGLKEILRRRCEAAGMKRLGLHMFRHSFAMIFLNDGEMELSAISQAMGHSSLEITRKFYAEFETTKLRRVYGRAVSKIGKII